MTSRSDQSSTWGESAVGAIHRAEWGRLLALLVTRTRRLDLAEDALAEAFARAVARWSIDGVPDNPPAWLYTTAYRLIVQRLRSEAMAGRKAPRLIVRDESEQQVLDGADQLPDERLQMLLLCCHPALDPSTRSALSLRFVVGTSTEEIARLFLVPVPTMAARITRAKRKIASAGIPLRRPVGEELERRLESVARSIYLAFTAGYTPGTGPALLRADLAGEAVHLAAVLHRLLPDTVLTSNLLALLLFQHSRRDARVEAGHLVTLAAQDRSRWRHDEIETALALLASAGSADGYALELEIQALIAREHAVAATHADTEWSTIVALYERLWSATGSPIVRMNQAVAVMEASDPQAALTMLTPLAEVLAAKHRFHAVQAEVLRRLQRPEQANAALEEAIRRCDNDVERAFLEGQRS